MKTFLAAFILSLFCLAAAPDEADAGRGRRMARRQARQENRQMVRGSYGARGMAGGCH